MLKSHSDPQTTPETAGIIARGYHGTDADYDRAIDELIKLGWTHEDANYAIMSAGW